MNKTLAAIALVMMLQGLCMGDSWIDKDTVFLGEDIVFQFNTIYNLTGKIVSFGGNKFTINDNSIYLINPSVNTTSYNLTVHTPNNISFYYEILTPTNLTIMLGDLGGDCNYGIFNDTDQNNSIHSHVIDVKFPRDISSLSECNITLVLNSTLPAGNYSILVHEDKTVGGSNLPIVVVASVVAIVVIIHVLKWDSKT